MDTSNLTKAYILRITTKYQYSLTFLEIADNEKSAQNQLVEKYQAHYETWLTYGNIQTIEIKEFNNSLNLILLNEQINLKG